MLTGRQGLAKVSGTPGKTRLINHFLIDNAWYLVDLPGYGYARTSKTKRSEFAKIITDYVLKCEKMHFLFVLVGHPARTPEDRPAASSKCSA